MHAFLNFMHFLAMVFFDYSFFIGFFLLVFLDVKYSYVVSLEFIPKFCYCLFIYSGNFFYLLFVYFKIISHFSLLSRGFLHFIYELTNSVLSSEYSADEAFQSVFHFTDQVLMYHFWLYFSHFCSHVLPLFYCFFEHIVIPKHIHS